MASGSAPDLAAWHREAVLALNARDYRRAHSLCIDILTHRPQAADAFFLLAMIAAAHDNHAKAVELIDRALKFESRAEYHAHRGRSLLALQRTREAFEAASRAMALDPVDALTLDTIGVVMTRAGAHAEALVPFERAVARDSTKAPYFYNLGASLQFVGRFKQAADAYRQALALEPFFYRTWSSLAQVARSPFSSAEMTLLEGLLGQKLDPEAELHVCHALAKQSEDEGRYADAFRYLERGKRRKRATLRYEFAADRELFAAAKQSEPAGTVAGYASAEPIFIVGMPRTGTTLVERILSSHPAVFAAGELTNFSLAIKRGTKAGSNRVLDAETLLAAAGVDLAAAGKEYVASTRPRTGNTPHFIDKMPLNFFYAGLIHRALPNAKIICLRRNPLDTVLSNYRQLFATSFSYYNYAYDLLDTGRYYIEFARLAQHWLATLPANYCEVHYERVVADTEAEARRLVAFCGLDWDPACLNFSENAAPVATASSVQVRQPIYTTAVERWRKYADHIQPLIELFRREGILDP